MANSLVPNKLMSQTLSASQSQAKTMLDNAIISAGTYLKGMKGLAGGSPDAPLKTMAREELDNKQMSDYYLSQGLVPTATSTDPSGEIRRLGQMYMNTTDPNLKQSYHQEALKLAQGAGWIQPGQQVDSVSTLPQMTNAGTENIDTIITMMNAYNNNNSSGGKGGKGGNDNNKIDDYINAIIETRKTPNDAKAQLQRDLVGLADDGFSSSEILELAQYIEQWQKDYADGKRYSQYGYFYTPKEQENDLSNATLVNGKSILDIFNGNIKPRQ